MAFSFSIDPEHGATHLGGASLVFHCHYYNCALQRSIEDGMGDGASELLRDAAVAAAHEQLRALGKGDASATLAAAAELHATLGFGVLDLSGLGPEGGRAVVLGSHYALGWLAVYGERSAPACHFAAGFVAAATRAAFGDQRVRVTETACVACGATQCEFTVTVER